MIRNTGPLLKKELRDYFPDSNRGILIVNVSSPFCICSLKELKHRRLSAGVEGVSFSALRMHW